MRLVHRTTRPPSHTHLVCPPDAEHQRATAAQALEATMAETKAAIDLLEPPPVRYSAVGRMRQQTEGMGMPKAEGAESRWLCEEALRQPVSPRRRRITR